MNLYFYQRNFTLHGPNEERGITKSIHGLAATLAESGTRVTVLCEGSQNEVVYPLGYGYVIRRFKLPPFGASIRLSGALRTFIAKEVNEGLFILNGMFNPTVAQVARCVKEAGFSYVLVPHDPYSDALFADHRWRKEVYFRFVEKPLLNHAAAVQLLDTRHGRFLDRRGIHTPMVVVPNGVDEVDLSMEPPEAWTAHTPARLLFLGRIDAYNKGLDLLLEALSRVVNRHDFRLTIQGFDTGDRPELERLVTRLGLKQTVTFLPPDFTRESMDIVREHDLFCMPSRFEGFGLAALEAMISERPVLISNIAGLAPHVRTSQGGGVVQPNVADIAAKLDTLLDRKPEWPEMGRRGRAHALEHLNWKTIAQNALRAYSSLMRSARAA